MQIRARRVYRKIFSSYYAKPTLVHGNKAKLKPPWPYCGSKWLLKFSSLALLRCKTNIQICLLGLIAVQNDFQIFRAWPYCDANYFFKFLSLALLRCKMTFQIFELGLIALSKGLALLPCTSVLLFMNYKYEVSLRRHSPQHFLTI